ncbi:MAG: acetylxylan esterase [Verrucomicrobia bacterium]|nr:acetylxylan esterase [Verrucomicrobiota bacterium]
MVAQPGDAVAAKVAEKQKAEGYRVDTVTLEVQPGFALDMLIAVPEQTGPRPVVLWMDAAPHERTAASADFVRLAKSGHLIMAFQPRSVLGEPPPNPNQLSLGHYMQPLIRSIAVGKTIIGLRTDDTIRALNYIVSRPDADASQITVYGKGAQGLVALHAAALDSRVSRLVIDGALVSYRMALNAGLHKTFLKSSSPAC